MLNNLVTPCSRGLSSVSAEVSQEPCLLHYLYAWFHPLVHLYVLFQIIEPRVVNLIHSPRAWKQTLSGFRRLPPAIVVYGLAVTSLTAGICEELVWRGYHRQGLSVCRMAGSRRPYPCKHYPPASGMAYQY